MISTGGSGDWSKSATRITGWSAEEVIGRRCLDNILCHIDKDGHHLCGEEYCPLHRAMVTGKENLEPLLVYARHKGGGTNRHARQCSAVARHVRPDHRGSGDL